ncbi:hypothetical protein B0J12DRAFT_665237 [Macrophomina phaseolina]|uniref:Secreted protein n=1 Tax=Macrophomina phaseolina TaxID=35725 RepID=A0ABQ8GA58_9PEZI|nr:hypothetical protein B0J12DRAFT_665237 [Macrophomina phaseolina]
MLKRPLTKRPQHQVPSAPPARLVSLSLSLSCLVVGQVPPSPPPFPTTRPGRASRLWACSSSSWSQRRRERCTHARTHASENASSATPHPQLQSISWLSVLSASALRPPSGPLNRSERLVRNDDERRSENPHMHTTHLRQARRFAASPPTHAKLAGRSLVP